MAKRAPSPSCDDLDDGNDHLFISLDENPTKRYNWGPSRLFSPKESSQQPASPKESSQQPASPKESSQQPAPASTMQPARQQPAPASSMQPIRQQPTPASSMQPARQQPAPASSMQLARQQPAPASSMQLARQQPAPASSMQLARQPALVAAPRRSYTTLAEWELGEGVRTTVVQCSDGIILIHIRTFTVENRPTMDGVTMLSSTWEDLSEKLLHFQFGNKSSSFVAANAILALAEENRVCLQNLLKSVDYCRELYKLKPYNVYLNEEQLNNLKSIIFDISEIIN
ncbi:unnamed protein product [Larinioides sclopetarius]|uniref:Uncharacterized protein n=1 Tax=Larinioides sclopetarius TaxID=280406 RepID=A0AAV2BQM5_9ARAC